MQVQMIKFWQWLGLHIAPDMKLHHPWWRSIVIRKHPGYLGSRTSPLNHHETSHTFRTGAWKRRYRFEPKDGRVEARHGWIFWACQMPKNLKPTWWDIEYWKLRLSNGSIAQCILLPWLDHPRHTHGNFQDKPCRAGTNAELMRRCA